MVNRQLLQSIINKYYLDENEKAKWIIKDKKITINFVSPTQEVIGEVNYDNFNMDDDELAIYDTKKLSNLIGITGHEILLRTERKHKVSTKLYISDTDYDLTYALADPMLIPTSKATSNITEFQATIPLTKENISSLIKAKNALSDSDNLRIITEEDMTERKLCVFRFGDEKGHNNNITYQIEGDIEEFGIELPFNANTFRNILKANKDITEGEMKINSRGLLKFTFKNEEGVTSTYYMARKEEDTF